MPSYYEKNRDKILARQRCRRSDPAHRAKMKEYSRMYYRRMNGEYSDESICFSITHGNVWVTFD
jgi:hypothetical protein